jgi:hypothetical protein
MDSDSSKGIKLDLRSDGFGLQSISKKSLTLHQIYF